VNERSILRPFGRDRRLKPIHPINLMAREGFWADVPACYRLYRSLNLPYSDALWRALPHMWRTMLLEGTMKLSLVEDRARPLGSRIVSFNAAAFVTDEFCSEARSTLPPYLGVELARRYLSRQLPVLNREQIAQANAHEGLNVLMCFERYALDIFSRERFLVVRERQNESLNFVLKGYRVKEFLADQIREEILQWMLGAGNRVRRDYSNWFRKHSVLKREPSERPKLVGLTKEEALANPGSNIAALFIYTPPRFHFNRSQRVLLRHALMGKTTEQQAASLALSVWTVKKLWRAIYDRVADVDGELLPASIAYGAHVSSRGAECRRQLLNYLRQHFEELRPFEPRGVGWCTQRRTLRTGQTNLAR
jgi:DNA-binding CsgD family transcriptional regulator